MNRLNSFLAWTFFAMLVPFSQALAVDGEMREVALSSQITKVQPMTGIVLWSDNEANSTDAIQLEYCYMRYDDVMTNPGTYNWSGVDSLLTQIASRGHQAILRFYFDYPGKECSVPAYIKALPDYEETKGESEGEATTFCDWSNKTLQQATLDFYSAFAGRYDSDPRLAFLQTGFGLWAEYHIYDGPMTMGKTFPSKEYQAQFAKHLAKTFVETQWSVSVDAADDKTTPLAELDELRALSFGLFDDSFLCKQHARENAKNWAAFGNDRWKTRPAGGEMSYYNKHDQKFALAEKGPNGVSLEQMGKQFHISYMIGDGQTKFQSMTRIAEAGMALGYRFRVTKFRTSRTNSEVSISNEGIAPIYYHAHPTVNGVRSQESLKGLLPGKSKTFAIDSGSENPKLTIQSDRLVTGQQIQFLAVTAETVAP